MKKENLLRYTFVRIIVEAVGFEPTSTSLKTRNN